MMVKQIMRTLYWWKEVYRHTHRRWVSGENGYELTACTHVDSEIRLELETTEGVIIGYEIIQQRTLIKF